MTVMSRIVLLVAVALIGACSPSTSPAPPTPGPAASTACVPPTASPTCTATAAPSPGTSPSAAAVTETPATGPLTFETETFRVPAGAHPHDVAVDPHGGVWYTGQRNGTLGWLDPTTGEVKEVPLGRGSAPHGVVVGADGRAYVTDQGLEAIVRVNPGNFEVKVFPVPGNVSPHTGVFDLNGWFWFTGAAGFISRLDPFTGALKTHPAPRGAGPYGITVTPSNEIWFVSLQQSYLGRVDRETGKVSVIEPPTANAGTRRVWSDSTGRLWVSYWNAGKVAVYDPAAGSWREWDLPGSSNQAYSMYVDELDAVWLSDFGQNTVVRFDAVTETFDSFPLEQPNAAVRQMLGRPGEAWGAESGIDRLIVIRYGSGD